MRRITAGVLLFLMLLSVNGVLLAQEERPDALVLYRQGRYSRAVEVTLEELRENPANLDSYTVLGWSLLALGRFEDALEYAEEGLDISRFDHRIVQIVGQANYQLGNLLPALDAMQRYVALAPSGSLIDEVYYTMGEIHIQLEEFHHADIALTTAVFLEPARALWWARLGYARELVGSPEYAASAYREALNRNPTLIEAQRGLERLGG